ncbi:MAG: SRPBCC family protein [Granulosicoccus sp.]
MKKYVQALLTGVCLSLVTSITLAHGPTRQKVSETIEIDAPAAEVWDLIKDFDKAADWLPMVESSEGEGGNEPGATRVLTLGPDIKVYETLKKHDSEKMSYSYKIPNSTHDVKILPVNNYSSTISVKAEGETSVVTWKGAFYRGYPNNDPPAELSDEAAVGAVSGLYQAGLANLKEMAESK